jgi:hypothetical protein
MKTNSKEFKKIIDLHILECVKNYNDNQLETVQKACEWLFLEFNRVANHENNKRRIPNDQDRFSDYLNGLPFDFLFYHEDIKNFLNSTGINPNNKEFKDELSLKRYHYFIYSRMLKYVKVK